MDILGYRLKEARDKNEMVQKFVCDKVGLSESALSSYENGKHQPSLETLISLAKLYNRSVDWLLGLTDEPSINTSVYVIPEKLTQMQYETLLPMYNKLASFIVKNSDK